MYVLFWVCYLGLAAVHIATERSDRWYRKFDNLHPLAAGVAAFFFRIAVFAAMVQFVCFGVRLGLVVMGLSLVTLFAIAGLGEGLALLIDYSLRRLYDNRGWAWPPSTSIHNLHTSKDSEKFYPMIIVVGAMSLLWEMWFTSTYGPFVRPSWEHMPWVRKTEKQPPRMKTPTEPPRYYIKVRDLDGTERFIPAPPDEGPSYPPEPAKQPQQWDLFRDPKWKPNTDALDRFWKSKAPDKRHTSPPAGQP